MSLTIMTQPSSPTTSSSSAAADESKLSPRETIQQVSSAVAPFLSSLFEILSKEDAAVIGWCDDGKAFAVYDYDTMERHILPTYFRHNKYASFQRQLNYFGFRKLHKAKDSDHYSVYCQPYFVKNDPGRMLLIKRKTHRVKSNTPRRAYLGLSTPTNAADYGYYQPHTLMHSPVYMPSGHSMYYTADSVYTPRTAASLGYSCSPHNQHPHSPDSNDAYDPLPFHRPADVFLVHPPASSPCEVGAFDHLSYNPFLPVKDDEFTSLLDKAVTATVDADTLPIPYTETTRESIKLSSDDLLFLSDETLCL
ncbi:Aste57867_12522 [Aphanomyces stellatus]|uniref:Aste57867_12522 protein n=1 Tax=Aphanomyces stellatus TaxID=120398 RepID=A0A485KXS3_9STRA|nr:hypothetical protein As57867_012476 [Aphanomyces stellatus]VFT89373.1 Aste57867_12522 [Aphanomyces stellatus]